MTAIARTDRSVPLLLWPFWALWKMISWLLVVCGRLVCGVLGFVLALMGGLFTVTVIGAPVGIPLAVVGLLLVWRALF